MSAAAGMLEEDAVTLMQKYARGRQRCGKRGDLSGRTKVWSRNGKGMQSHSPTGTSRCTKARGLWLEIYSNPHQPIRKSGKYMSR